MSDLSDVERDAVQAVQALAGLNIQLSQCGETDGQRLRQLAYEGGAAASRVLAYLRLLRGAGDGEAMAYPARLGPWRDWCPPRGNVLGEPDAVRNRQPRSSAPSPPGHGDPGE